MKKLYFSFFILVQFGMFAQNYVPTLDSLNVWYYTFDGMVVLQQQTTENNSVLTSPTGWNTYDHYTDGDSVINSFTYKKLHQAYPYPNPGALQGFVREDTASRKIYYIPQGTTTEYLIYDYSLQIGDSTFIQILNGSGMFQTGYYTLDSIKNKTFNSISRRVFYLSNPNSGLLEWVEGIGNRGDFVYTDSWLMGFMGWSFSMFCGYEFPYNCGQILTCFNKNENRLYFDTCALYVATVTGGPCYGFTDSCNYGYWCGGLNEFTIIREVKLFPNPANINASLEIEAQQNTIMCIRIIDALGRTAWMNPAQKFIQGKNIVDLNIDKLNPGIYQVVLSDDKRSYYTKLCVE